MSIHTSLCPQPHNAMNFWHMMCDSVRLPTGGTMAGLARKLSRSAVVIGRGGWLSSRFRAFTKSMCAVMPFLYAVQAAAALPAHSAASALMNCSSAYVITGIFDLSEKMYRAGNPKPLVQIGRAHV